MTLAQLTRLPLLFFFVGIVLICITLTNFSSRTLDITRNDASIVFIATPGMVLFEGNCVQVTWEANNIQTIFINGDPATGFGEQRICIDEAVHPTLTITYQN
ncbi:MAG: hypothetical protein ACPG7F_02295, partial [Aggregatilineales bacterium]